MTRPTLSPDSESKRFQMMITEAELDAINEWAWENRTRSLSEAVRRLIQLGLEAAKDQSHPDSVGAGVRFYNPMIGRQ